MGRLKLSLVTEPKYARDAAALFREMKSMRRSSCSTQTPLSKPTLPPMAIRCMRQSLPTRHMLMRV